MLKSDYDVLFVINQDTDIDALHRLAKKRSYQNILFLTTHYLFDTERQLFSGLFNNPTIVDFTTFLSEDEMDACDKRASDELLAEYDISSLVRENYNELFMHSSLKYKNEIVARKIHTSCTITQGFFSEGLGIAPDVWSSYKFALLPSLRKHNICSRYMFGYKIARQLLWFLTPRTVNIFRHGNQLFIFFCPIHRLNLAVDPTVTRFVPWHFWFLGKFTRGSIVASFINSVKNAEDRVVIGTTVHNYESWLTGLKQPIQIFIDGFHPSNYPRSYVDSFQVGEFVVRNMFDNLWFDKFGKKTVKPGPFLQFEYFKPILDVDSPVNTVCLLLNHAGDWTALINRSDTDILIQQFVDAARDLPHIHFVIRPHPTMVHSMHEGENSINRIENFVIKSGLTNLKISKSSLDTDLMTADLFVSEYSQTILDVYKIGKKGLIANLTNRRSFMTDYESLGFAAINNKSLCDAINDIVKCPASFSSKQNIAVENYNFSLSEFVG